MAINKLNLGNNVSKRDSIDLNNGNSQNTQSDSSNNFNSIYKNLADSMAQINQMRDNPSAGKSTDKEKLQGKLASLDAQITVKRSERMKAGEVYDNFYRDPAAAWGAEGGKPSHDLEKAKVELQQLEAERAEVKQELDSLNNANNPFSNLFNVFGNNKNNA